MSPWREHAKRLRTSATTLGHEAVRISWALFKIMVPVSIVTRLLNQYGVVKMLGDGLAPAMDLLGLPGSMGLVWATTLVTNIYGGMVVFAQLAPTAGLTVAQVTVLATIILVAHSLPVELKIAQAAGPRLRAMLALRVGGALVLGALLDRLYRWGGWLQQPNTALWQPKPPPDTWAAWGLAELRNYAMIFAIIVALLLLMRLLRALGLMKLLDRLLGPLLRALGMSPAVAPITVVAMALGLSYGGGLIIAEARSGRLAPRDVFLALALMGLCHSLLEDSLLMMALGAHHSGVFWGRLVFSLAAIWALQWALRRVNDAQFARWCYRALPPAKPTTQG